MILYLKNYCDIVQKINLNIAGFNICLRMFFKKKKNFPIFFREVLKNEILGLSEGFVTDESVKKSDFYIDFVDKFEPEIIQKKDSSKIYSLIYEERAINRVITFNQVSVAQFHAILVSILLKLLAKNNGFVLHSSCANIIGKANMFLGSSEAGKSTAVNLLNKNYLTLSDDLSIIKEESGKFYFYQTPFMEKQWWTRKTSFRYPIERIFFIRKSPFFKIVKIDNTEYIINRLLKQLIAEKKIEESMKTTLRFAANFDNFYFLYFDKNEDKMLELFQTLR